MSGQKVEESKRRKIPSEKTMNLEEIVTKLEDWMQLEDTEAFKILLASALSLKAFDVKPVWLFLVSPPTSIRIRLLQFFKRLPFTCSWIDPEELANYLGTFGLYPALFVFDDLSSIFFMTDSQRNKVLLSFKKLHDRIIFKNARIGLLAGVTDVIDSHPSLSQILDEDFIQIRLRQRNHLRNVEKFIQRLDDEGSDERQDREIAEAIRTFIEDFEFPLRISKVRIPRVIEEKLAGLIVFCSRTRVLGADSIPELGRQLGIITRIMAKMDGVSQVTECHYETAKRIAVDCIPKNTWSVLKFLMKNDPSTVSSIAESICLEELEVRRVIRKLERQGLVRQTSKKRYDFTSDGERLLSEVE